VTVAPEDAASSQPSTIEPADPAVESVGHMRKDRLQDLLQQALRTESPLEANLGAVKVDLFEMTMQLKKFLAKAFPNQPENWDEFGQMMQGYDNYLKLTKQIDRFTQLDIKLKDMESRAAETRAVISKGQEPKSEKVAK
jgi:hypothetical protein